MGRIEELGTSFTVPDDIKHWYRLQPQVPAPAAASVESTEENVAMEVDEGASASEQAAPGAASTSSGEQLSHRDDFWGRSHDSLIMSYIDVFGKVIRLVFSHSLFG